MRKEEKNVLVYADGRIEEIDHQLVGDRFVKAEMVGGDMWLREFHCEPAFNSDDGPYTRVAVECHFARKYTAAEIATRDAEQREETLRRVLKGISLAWDTETGSDDRR